jgi:glycerol-3-phosphate acyltransferase PlsY
VLLPVPFLAAFLCWLTAFVSSRYMSLASLMAAATLCILRLAFTPDPWGRSQAIVSGFCVVAATLVVVRHHANIGRLLRGSENRFGDTPAMNVLNKTLHVVAVGLWFGTIVFFTLVGAILFPTLAALAARPVGERPVWLDVPAAYDKAPPSDHFPNPLRKELGSRIAGAVVEPLFPWYFAVQGVCGLVALATALAWVGRKRERVQRLRAGLLAVALTGVGVGWLLEGVVDGVRGPRNQWTDEVLNSPAPSAAAIARAEKARQAFATWHAYSLAANFATLLLVTASMVLAAQLPGSALAPPTEADKRDLQLAHRQT